MSLISFLEVAPSDLKNISDLNIACSQMIIQDSMKD